MTKRVMTKKFMRETGADKKTAMEYLRKCQWNYGSAKTLYYAPATLAELADRIASIDWSEVIQNLADTVNGYLLADIMYTAVLKLSVQTVTINSWYL